MDDLTEGANQMQPDAHTERVTAPIDDRNEHVGLVEFSRNPTIGFFRLFVRGHEVPYVEVFRYPTNAEGVQVYPAEGDEHDGETYRWDLVLDRRLAFGFETREEINAIAPLLADAMAVAAGRTAHGVANQTNPHGPATVPS